MRLAERHIINQNHPFYKECDSLCFRAKNLYNYALYQQKKLYDEGGSLMSGYDMCKELKGCHDYKQLPAKVSSGVLIDLGNSYKSFFRSLSLWKKDKSKFKSCPQPPKFLHKTKGRFRLEYAKDAVSKTAFEKFGSVKPSKSDIYLPTSVSFDSFQTLRISPCFGYFIMEVVYTVPEVLTSPDNGNVAAIDLGVSNLATVVTNVSSKPFIVNGRPLKSINQFYNKRKAHYQSKLKNTKHSKRLDRLNLKRNCKVDNYLHKSSKLLVNKVKELNCTTLVVGSNKEWKSKINIGKRNNQNFVSIPHSRFISMLRYKCTLAGIAFVLQEESYTSKCSFLDLETVCKHDVYVGRRVSRGLFRSSNGKKINADVNGAFNIMRKASPNAFGNGVEGVLVHPEVVNLAS